MKALELIASYGLPNHSYIQAVHALNIVGDLGEMLHRERINELGGYPNQSEIVPDMLPFVYAYMVQEIVREPTLLPDELFELALHNAYDFVNNNTYVFARPEEEIKLDASGKVKQKKGAKKEMAEALALEFKGAGLTRQEWITKLVEEVDMTRPGASSYYARMKKENLI